MKIQIVSEYFYPDNFRINDIVLALTKQGHAVSVLTGLPDYATGYIPCEYHKFQRRKENILGADVHRVSMMARRTGTLFRMLNYGTFLFTSTLYALFTKRPNCDVIFVYETSPIFQALPAIVFKKRTKKKLVLYCCDLWPESMKAWGIQESNPIFKAVKWISGWIYRQCDIVAITSTPFRSYLTTVCGVDDQKIVYLPQHAEDDYADIACQYEDNDCIDFVFAGNIGSVQNVDIILRASAKINVDKHFMVHIVGDGSELENCKQLATELNLNSNIIFHGRYPLSEMKQFYKITDCFLLTLRSGDFIGKTLPAKAQGYLCAGKPIVAAIDGAGREMIEESDCGEVVAASDVDGLALSMTKVIDNFDFYKTKGKNGRKFYEQNYTKEIFMRHLLNILEGE